MIFARTYHEIDASEWTAWSAGAIAPHRGDVTTVRAAAAVSAKRAKRLEEVQSHIASRRTAGIAPLPASGWTGGSTQDHSAPTLL